MALNIYMTISDINGPSAAKGHQNAFEVFTVSYGAVAALGKDSFTPVTVTLNAYNGPKLLAALARAEAHTVTLQTYEGSAQGTQVLFETIALTNAVITQFQETINNGDTTPTLELAFAYGKFTYTQNNLNPPATFTYEPGR